MKFTKSLWTAGLAAFAMLLVLPSTASADNCRSQGSCSRCGHRVYAVQQLVGYDRCGKPIFAWATQPHNCGYSRGYTYSNRQTVYPSRGYYGSPCPDRGYSHGNSGYSNRGSYGSRGCPPSRGGFSITFGF